MTNAITKYIIVLNYGVGTPNAELHRTALGGIKGVKADAMDVLRRARAAEGAHTAHVFIGDKRVAVYSLERVTLVQDVTKSYK